MNVFQEILVSFHRIVQYDIPRLTCNVRMASETMLKRGTQSVPVTDYRKPDARKRMMQFTILLKKLTDSMEIAIRSVVIIIRERMIGSFGFDYLDTGGVAKHHKVWPPIGFQRCRYYVLSMDPSMPGLKRGPE